MGQIFCLLNLLAFLFHGIQRLIDGGYRNAYGMRQKRLIFSGRCATK
jgi:hypothetical protein